MPYLCINTAQTLDTQKKDALKAELGRLMSIIPTKDEAGLMVDFSGGHTVYKAGANVNGAFVDLKLYGKSDLEPKKQYTAKVLELLCRELGIQKEHIYMTISEFDTWGSRGELHSR